MPNPQIPPEQGEAACSQGTLLGIVLDLSGSMYESIANETGGQFSRIEGLTDAFGQVMEDVQLLLKEHAAREHPRLRLFMYGFGLWCGEGEPQEYAFGDILSVLAGLNERMQRYRPLLAEVESMWSEELANVLEERKIAGDAKEELRNFVEQELKEQAMVAEQQSSAVKLQRWCASMCRRLSKRADELERRMARYQGWQRILSLLTVLLLWPLRGLAFALALLNRTFEAWLRRKLADVGW